MTRIMTKVSATKFFAILFKGEHHIPSEIKRWGSGWSINMYGDMATFDFSFMTRLVLLSHDCAVRSKVQQGGARRLKICIWQRIRDGNSYERHPTIEEAIKTWRKEFNVKWKFDFEEAK